MKATQTTFEQFSEDDGKDLWDQTDFDFEAYCDELDQIVASVVPGKEV